MLKPLYIFIGIHSLLSGFFIFFIPVFLWKLGFNLSQISLFISITGLSFAVSIYFWDKLRQIKDINFIIYISFLLEILLLTIGFFTDKIWFLYALAITYGIYNCFFWLTQRILFLRETSHKNIGKNFGNIQIIAFLLIKVGILVGSYLLEFYDFFYLWIVVFIINILGIILFYNKSLIKNKKERNHVKIEEIISFTDKYNSRKIFLLDGPFLFFESFFWVISLFLITNESYTQLGYLTIFLALSFTFSFYLIKNKIDKFSGNNIYIVSVILYASSWIFRGHITEIESQTLVYTFILIIAFFTSFFRLTFNKKFFHITKDTLGEKYIILKSYYSQVSIFIIFGILSYLIYLDNNIVFEIIYYILAIFSLIYLKYNNIKKEV